MKKHQHAQLLPEKIPKKIFKNFEKFREIFSFSDFENLKIFQNQEKSKKSKKNRKFSKQFSKKNDIFLEKVAKHVSSSLQLISRDEFRTGATFSRFFEFQLFWSNIYIGPKSSFCTVSVTVHALPAPDLRCRSTCGGLTMTIPRENVAKRCIHPARPCRGRRGHREKLRGSETQLTAPNEGILPSSRCTEPHCQNGHS